MNRKSIGSLLKTTVLFEVRACTANSRMKYRMDYTACSICFLFGNNVKTLTCKSGYERFVLFSQKWHQHFHLEYQSVKITIKIYCSSMCIRAMELLIVCIPMCMSHTVWRKFLISWDRDYGINLKTNITWRIRTTV